MPADGKQAVLDALQRGDIAAAEALCESFLEAGGGAEGVYLAGVIRSMRGDGAAARGLLDRAATLLPDRADIAYNHGVILREGGDLAAAAAEWRRAIGLDPGHRDATVNLALALDNLGDRAGAETTYRLMLERWPEDRDGLYNFANFCQRGGAAQTALDAYLRLLRVHPGFVKGWINLGMLLKREHQPDGAERCYRQAIAIDPGSAAAHFNLANLLLGRGQWAEGFAEYEWRLLLPEAAKPGWQGAPWTGAEPPGTRVILWGDQGHGDAIQFLRHAAAVAAKGHRVFVVVKDGLRRLAARAPGVEAAFAPGDEIPAADAHLPLASLPHRLGLSDSREFWTGPYLEADASESPELPGTKGMKIGLVWAGDARHPNDLYRSARLEQLAPLFAVPGVAWVSLQVGEPAAQLAASPWAGGILDIAPQLRDFAVTAAAIARLDLLVTVDTAVAHVAGAMGRPAWVLLPAIDSDWRWLDEGDTTPWYPTLRLFRQSARGDWDTVARAVAAALAATAEST